MPSFNIFTVLLLLLCFTTRMISSQPLSYFCPNTTTLYARNSTYHTNLNLLLSNLSSNATTHDTGFYSSVTGRSPDTVYGLFLCRGDVTIDQCQDCVTNASKEILQVCPNETVAIVWYDHCLLRYSNKNIFSITDTSVGLTMWNTQNITNPIELSWAYMQNTMNELARSAAVDKSGKKFAAEVAYYTTYEKVYALVQCTPDLSSDGCYSCLGDAISEVQNCCDLKLGGRLLFPSCNIRYEFYPFFNRTASPAPNPSPVPPQLLPPTSPTATGSTGEFYIHLMAYMHRILIINFLFWANSG